MVENTVKLFFSYAHEDEALRDELATHLSSLERRGVISSWHDRKLAGGMEWDNEIKSQLESADIILLLISPAFMASEYCHEVEIPLALERHKSRDACVVPVILRPCDWYDERFAKLQASPKDARPVTLWQHSDEAFVSVVQTIRTATELLRENRKRKLEKKEAELEKKEADKSRYRQKVKEVLSDGVISDIERDTLDELREELGLTLEEAKEIEDYASETHNKRNENRKKYEKTLKKLVEKGCFPPFDEKIEKELEDRQRDLGLSPQDAIEISEPIFSQAKLAYQERQRQQAEAERLQKLEQQQRQKQEEYNAKLERYRQGFVKAIQAEYPLNPYVIENLKEFQTQLELKDKDVAQIEQSIYELTEAQYQEKPKHQTEAQQQQIGQQHKQVFEFDVITVNKKGIETNRTRKTTEFFAEDLGNGILLEMVNIPSGTFQMGSPKDQGNNAEKPQRSVTLSPFIMGKFPVTQAQWCAVTGLPRVNVHLDPEPANFKGDNRPVEQVSWYEAVEFCDRLSQKTGRTYRLPTEAEWEYACRAGTTTPFHFGEALPEGFPNCNTGNVVTFYTKALSSSTANVGSFNFANDFGLYDMHGNVWEWCLDHWHDNYQNAPINGKAWISEDEGQSRVLRGGSWDYSPRDCRSASRIRYTPNFRLNVIGFRVVAE